MRKIIMKSQAHTILFCISAIVLSFAIYNIIHVFLTHFHVDRRFAEALGRVAASIVIIAFYNRFFDLQDFGFQKKNLLHGILIGGFMFLATLNNLAASILSVSEFPFIMPSMILICIVIFEQISVGIFEEFLFRGLILNVLLHKSEARSAASYKNKITAIAVSSVFFGLVHLLNLISAPSLLNATIDQVFYSVFIGVFLGALYLRTHNIWVVVFYHSVYDIASELPVIFHEIPAQAITDETLPEAVLNILVSAIFLFVGLFIARKLKERPKPD